MDKGPLGRLTPVDLRSHWEREDTDFTPWLAEEDNIGLLGDTIGMELEVQEQEANVGPFRADILCRNTADNTFVLVENQLERTDHTHLGQLMTYAAGLDAVTIVWVVQQFTEEHRAALDWLNRITDEDFRFFGLEIELWRIGDSTPAPKFNLVAKPNDWSKTVKEVAQGARGKLTPGQQLQVDYWTSFGEFLAAQQSTLRAPKPYPSNWMSYGLGRSGCSLIIRVAQQEMSVGVDVDKKDHPTWYTQLEEQREEIESDLDCPLVWEEKPENRYALIRVKKECDLQDSNQWPDIHTWLVKYMVPMQSVFRPRVKLLEDGPHLPVDSDE